MLKDLLCTACDAPLSSAPIFSNNETTVCYRCFTPSLTVHGNYVREKPLEDLLTMSLFPCVFRSSGCPQYSKFGKDSMEHEENCLYRPKERRGTRNTVQIDPDGKMRGIIQNHRGAMWGTISPNQQIFVNNTETSKHNGMVVHHKTNPTQEQGCFYEDLKKRQEQFQQKRHPQQNYDYLPQAHASHQHRDSITSDTSSLASSYNSRQKALSDTEQMMQIYKNQKYPAALDIPRDGAIRRNETYTPGDVPNKTQEVKRSGSYMYDTNYHKVMKEFKIRKKIDLDDFKAQQN